MTKQDWRYFWGSMAVSIFVGATVLTMIVLKNHLNRKKLSLKKLNTEVEKDLAFWKGINETTLKGAERISEYWKLINFNFTPAQIITQSHRQKWYWSAIYISDLMNRWGSGDRFKFSSSHANYIVDGKEARSSKNRDSIFYSYNPSEIDIAVGDLIGKSRKSGVTLDTLSRTSPTHTDLVYKLEKNSTGYIAYAIGGNVSNTVKTTKYYLDKNKKIQSPEKYLVVMKNQKI